MVRNYDANRFPDHVLLTMVGIKLLNEHFSGTRKIWMLVERKARKYILQQGQLDQAALNQALDSLVVSLIKVFE